MIEAQKAIAHLQGRASSAEKRAEEAEASLALREQELSSCSQNNSKLQEELEEAEQQQRERHKAPQRNVHRLRLPFGKRRVHRRRRHRLRLGAPLVGLGRALRAAAQDEESALSPLLALELSRRLERWR